MKKDDCLTAQKKKSTYPITDHLLSLVFTSAIINASARDSFQVKTNHNAKTSTHDADSQVPCSLLQRGSASGIWNGSFIGRTSHLALCLRYVPLSHNPSERRHKRRHKEKEKLWSLFLRLCLCLRQARFHGEVSALIICPVRPLARFHCKTIEKIPVWRPYALAQAGPEKAVRPS